jgi:hypothetical protein
MYQNKSNSQKTAGKKLKMPDGKKTGSEDHHPLHGYASAF